MSFQSSGVLRLAIRRHMAFTAGTDDVVVCGRVFPESVKYTDTKGSNLPSVVLETRMPPHDQLNACKRQDLLIYLNSCFSDLSDSLSSLNFRSIQVKLHYRRINAF